MQKLIQFRKKTFAKCADWSYVSPDKTGKLEQIYFFLKDECQSTVHRE